MLIWNSQSLHKSTIIFFWTATYKLVTWLDYPQKRTVIEHLLELLQGLFYSFYSNTREIANRNIFLMSHTIKLYQMWHICIVQGGHNFTYQLWPSFPAVNSFPKPYFLKEPYKNTFIQLKMNFLWWKVTYLKTSYWPWGCGAH